MSIVAETTSGSVEGRAKDGVLLFAGIPYAAPPVGDRRWRPPEPHPGWSGVRDATSFGKVSMQTAGALESLAGGAEPDWDEDCLFLNVQTPALDGEGRPVMVWIHGGGFSTGAGSVPWYDGAGFVRRGDVVVVTINYRLGLLGWLHLGAVPGADPSAGNCGLLDQIAALRWVRDNIAVFGGDPDDVTVFGESAGGMSVATLMGTPSAEGLFHKAIPQSGAAHNVATIELAAEVEDRVLAELGSRELASLLEVPAARLLAVQQDVSMAIARERAQRPGGTTGSALGLPFSPVVDGRVLPHPPLEGVRAGLSRHVALLTGTTAEEWKLFGLMLRSVEDEETILRRLGRMVEDPHTLAAVYRQGREDASHDEVWCDILTDRIFRVPAVRLAEAQAVHQPEHTFMYSFDWRSTAFEGRLGACHALEIPFVFDNLDKAGVELFTGPGAPRALADAMHRAWIAFARSALPGHDGLPDWPAYDTTGRSTMHFGDSIEIRHDPRAETRAVWEGII